MRVITLCLATALTLAAGGAPAQQNKGHGGNRPQHHQMSQKDRQQMREDVREAYRSRDRERPERQRPMSREERDKLRRDVEDANRQMRR